MKKVVHVHTCETLATAPARFLALQNIASLSDRELAFFHWRAAQELLEGMQHKIRDYDDECSTIQPFEYEHIGTAAHKISQHLVHVVAIAKESSDRVKVAIQKANGGAS